MTGHFLPPPVNHFLGFLIYSFFSQIPGNPTVSMGLSFMPNSCWKFSNGSDPISPASTKSTELQTEPSLNSLFLYLEAANLRSNPKQRILLYSIPHPCPSASESPGFSHVWQCRQCFVASPFHLIFKPPPEQKNSGAVKRTHRLENTRTSPVTHPAMLKKKKKT